jgi:hypothetical protein
MCIHMHRDDLRQLVPTALGRSPSEEGMAMLAKKLQTRLFVAACVGLAIVAEMPGTALGQRAATSQKGRARRSPAGKSAARSPRRPQASTVEKFAADRVVLRDGKELLGQVDDASADVALTILARREMVRTTLPDRARKWEEAERDTTATALRRRRERLAAWRRDRPEGPAAGDRITAWLDRELAGPPGPVAPSPLMAIRLGRDEVAAAERRSEPAARALRAAWLLGLADPEKIPLARLKERIAERGLVLEDDVPVAIDRLLPPAAESEDRWALRRAATEALHDQGLRFIQFGTTLLPEPVPGQPLDPAGGMTLVEGTIRDVLGVGGADPLPSRLRAVAARGRVGVIVTRIEISPDLARAAAESTLYVRRGDDWGRGLWRSESLGVGAVPPVVASIVASDPQVKAVMGLIDTIGAGFVSPELKERGLVVGTTVGGAVALARTALVRSLMGLAFDVEGKSPARMPRTDP